MVDEEIDGRFVPMESYQVDFFEGPFKETIREMSGEELSKFFEFCTGYDYMPYAQNFRIATEFSLVADDALPTAHTCEINYCFPEKLTMAARGSFRKS
mmetsp:Transcript_18465/g.26204  ORF Transcript_18465/g.26204 Transcript_18465/m.26204 type:complete len:98 (-) Transcript_18465:230-523(-)